MNAQEMRSVSEANSEKLGKREVKEAIEELKQKISKNASEGLWESSISISNKTVLVRSGNLHQVVDHFEENGFTVGVKDDLFGTQSTVIVSWRSDEEE